MKTCLFTHSGLEDDLHEKWDGKNPKIKIYYQECEEDDPLNIRDQNLQILFFDEDNRIQFDECEITFNGKPHRDGDEPAIIYEISEKIFFHSYYKEGKRHRTEGPSVIFNSEIGPSLYFFNNELIGQTKVLAEKQLPSIEILPTIDDFNTKIIMKAI